MERVILHADMNNYYAAIEIKLNPKWRGLPLAVCGSEKDRQGIVLAKSQEAKILGVKTGEAIWEAKQKCPDLLLVPPHYDQYLKHSRLARKIYYEYTNLIEPFGIDECWLDVTGSRNMFGSGKEIADELRQRIKSELGITISVGVSFNKVFAKLASDLKKPDAVTEIPKNQYKEIVWDLAVEEMIGIGRSTKRKLNKYSIYTLGDLANTSPEFLQNRLGINGLYLWNYANGQDKSPVSDLHSKSLIKTIGNSTTCTEDLINEKEAYNVLQELALNVSQRLRENKLEATGVQISVRNSNLHWEQFQYQLTTATQSSIIMAEEGYKLFKERYNWHLPIRSIGIRAIGLIRAGSYKQVDFFHNYKEIKKKESIDFVIYKLRQRYGKNNITFASLIKNLKISKDRSEVVTLPNALTM